MQIQTPRVKATLKWKGTKTFQIMIPFLRKFVRLNLKIGFNFERFGSRRRVDEEPNARQTMMMRERGGTEEDEEQIGYKSIIYKRVMRSFLLDKRPSLVRLLKLSQ
jgi:hypothetical protein